MDYSRYSDLISISQIDIYSEFNIDKIPNILPIINQRIIRMNKLMIHYKDQVTQSRNNPPVYEEFDALEEVKQVYLGYTNVTPK